jgi:hypothetical protein
LSALRTTAAASPPTTSSPSASRRLVSNAGLDQGSPQADFPSAWPWPDRLRDRYGHRLVKPAIYAGSRRHISLSARTSWPRIASGPPSRLSPIGASARRGGSPGAGREGRVSQPPNVPTAPACPRSSGPATPALTKLGRPVAYRTGTADSAVGTGGLGVGRPAPIPTSSSVGNSRKPSHLARLALN